jgi:hypothetical protein
VVWGLLERRLEPACFFLPEDMPGLLHFGLEEHGSTQSGTGEERVAMHLSGRRDIASRRELIDGPLMSSTGQD